jgi:hypothetical protein
MAILGFKKQFVQPIRKRTKDQTIRRYRKYPIMTFEHLYLYTGLRNRYVKAEKIGEAQCRGTYPITITRNSVVIQGLFPIRLTLPKDLDDFARRDGFNSWQELVDFWLEAHGPKCFPFKGTVIYFDLLSKRNWKKA